MRPGLLFGVLFQSNRTHRDRARRRGWETAGRRITIQNIAIWHERMGESADEIATEYDLTLADVYAALAYYFDRRAEIDESIN